MRKPWFRKHDRWWYLTENGKKIRLSQDKVTAHRLWHERHLLASGSRENVDSVLLLVVLDEYLSHVQANHLPTTIRSFTLPHLQPSTAQEQSGT